ncbi:MAG: hypothetical protein II921_05505 [Treponema sp.]|nr:hypothetical protein [Treponema sp.]
MGKKYSISKKEENGILYVDVQFDGDVVFTARSPRCKIVAVNEENAIKKNDGSTTSPISHIICRNPSKPSKEHFKTYVKKILEEESIHAKEINGVLYVTVIYAGKIFDEKNNVFIEKQETKRIITERVSESIVSIM